MTGMSLDMNRFSLIVVWLLLGLCHAQDTLRVCPLTLVWKDAKPPMPIGTKIAVLEGNPADTGFFTIRVQLPANSLLPVHYHLREERVTLISGEVFVGFGDQPNRSTGTKFTPGCFYINPALSHHYVYTRKKPAVLQLTGKGPWTFILVE